MSILGIDVSTACTGICLLDDKTGSLIDMLPVKLSKIKSKYDKAQAVRQLIQRLHSRHSISKIFIEENLQAFRPGFSSAKTLVTLARFNGVVSFIVEDVTGVAPVFLNVTSARKEIGCKIQRQKVIGKTTKDQVLEFVKQQPEVIAYQWPMKTISRGKNRGQVTPADECYDMADAFVVSKAGILYKD